MSVSADMLKTAPDVLFSCLCSHVVDTIVHSIMITKMQQNQIIIQHILLLFVMPRVVEIAVTLALLLDHWQRLNQMTCH